MRELFERVDEAASEFGTDAPPLPPDILREAHAMSRLSRLKTATLILAGWKSERLEGTLRRDFDQAIERMPAKLDAAVYGGPTAVPPGQFIELAQTQANAVVTLADALGFGGYLEIEFPALTEPPPADLYEATTLYRDALLWLARAIDAAGAQ